MTQPKPKWWIRQEKLGITFWEVYLTDGAREIGRVPYNSAPPGEFPKVSQLDEIYCFACGSSSISKEAFFDHQCLCGETTSCRCLDCGSQWYRDEEVVDEED